MNKSDIWNGRDIFEHLIFKNILWFDEILSVISSIKRIMWNSAPEVVNKTIGEIEGQISQILQEKVPDELFTCSDIDIILDYLNDNANKHKKELIENTVSKIEKLKEKYFKHKDYIKVASYYYKSTEFDIEESKYIESFEKIWQSCILYYYNSPNLFNIENALDVYERILQRDKSNKILLELMQIFNEIKNQKSKVLLKSSTEDSNHIGKTTIEYINILEEVQNYNDLINFLKEYSENIYPYQNTEILEIIAEKLIWFEFEKTPRINKYIKNFINHLSEVEEFSILLLKILKKYHSKSIMYKKLINEDIF